jgi:outer membrane protein
LVSSGRLAVLSCVVCVCIQSLGQTSSPTLSDVRASSVSVDALTSAASTVPASTPDSNRIELSLQQAIRMALENNLDIKLEQENQAVSDFGVERTKGGGTPTQINYGIAEAPAGVGLSAMPLLTSGIPASVNPSGLSVSSSYDSGHVLEGSHSLSIAQGTYSPGSGIPAYDVALQGQLAWIRRNPVTSITPSNGPTPADEAITDNTLGNTTVIKGFSSGASLQLGVNDFTQSFYSGRSSAIPFSKPNAIALFVQPLLRGAGRSNNTRLIVIAQANRKISAAVLEQQMISTISGVETLYYDLAGLQDSVAVQEDALRAAEDLLSNDKQQLDVGRMPPIEVARVEALVSANRLALTQAISLRDQQQIVLRTLLDPKSLTQASGELPTLVANDTLSLPPEQSEKPVEELIQTALSQRPDIRQAKLQVANGERSVAGSSNARLPEVDLYGSFQNRGVIAPDLLPIAGDPSTGMGQIDPIPAGGKSVSRVFEAGIQFNLPIQNRVARANLGSDRAELQQEKTRLTQLEAQAAAEVRNTRIALAAARVAAQSATNSRILQEQLVGAEMEKFRAGMSSNFAVIEQETYLTQAKTTEVAARAAWKKAAIQLDRALGETLQHTGIALDSQ